MCNIYIIPESPTRSNIDSFFKGRRSVLLKHCKNYPNYNEGDTGYLYVTKPEQRIRFKTIITRTNVSATEGELTNPTWNNPEDLKMQVENNNNDEFYLIKDLSPDEQELLSIENLRKHGFSDFPHGLPVDITTNKDLIDYIEAVINK